MAKIGREFFLARKFKAPDPYVSANFIPVPTQYHELECVEFEPGEGPRFKEFLTGKMNTGESKPRALPKDVYNKVAHLVNIHRSTHRDGNTAYVVLLLGVGGNRVSWSLEKMSSKAGRFDPVKMGANNLKDHPRAETAVFQSELDNLRIKCWHRELHYTIYLTTFESMQEMNLWWIRYSTSTQITKRVHMLEQITRESPSPPYFWFKTMGWQRLPDDFISNLDDDAKALVFPSDWQITKNALKAAPGPGQLLPFTFLYELNKEASMRGPQNCVKTEYQADVKIVLCRGIR